MDFKSLNQSFYGGGITEVFDIFIVTVRIDRFQRPVSHGICTSPYGTQIVISCSLETPAVLVALMLNDVFSHLQPYFQKVMTSFGNEKTQ